MTVDQAGQNLLLTYTSRPLSVKNDNQMPLILTGTNNTVIRVS